MQRSAADPGGALRPARVAPVTVLALVGRVLGAVLVGLLAAMSAGPVAASARTVTPVLDPGVGTVLRAGGFAASALVEVRAPGVARRSLRADGRGVVAAYVVAPRRAGSYQVIFVGPATAAPHAEPGRPRSRTVDPQAVSVTVPHLARVVITVRGRAGAGRPTGTGPSGAEGATAGPSGPVRSTGAAGGQGAGPAGSGGPAVTGTDIALLVAAGGASVALGAVIVAWARRRRGEHTA